MTVKRSREDREVEALAMANCLMLLSNMARSSTTAPPSSDRVFSCKTCNKQFSSFQALGGHRASHKRPRLMAAADVNEIDSPAKPKTHECPFCGLEFSLGQALGGHMRRHRNDRTASLETDNKSAETLSASQKSNTDSHNRILLLDLNLTPDENDLKFDRLDCFL